MAKMFPKNLTLYEHTKSELQVFNALKTQLDDRISVFFSVSWISIVNGEKEQSESDFLIFDPKYGFLTCEVKGGKGIKIEGNEWILELDGHEERKLKRSPMKQAEESARYFANLYSSEYNYAFKGIYGHITIFPNFEINDPCLRDNNPKEFVLDIRNMSSLGESINKSFILLKRQYNTRSLLEDQKNKFLSLIHKRIAIAAAAGALINDKEKEFDTINRVQDNYIYMIKDYPQAFICGGAGTGKTWIGLKMAYQLAMVGKKVLMTCFNKELINFLKLKTVGVGNINIFSIEELLLNDGIKVGITFDSDKYYDEYGDFSNIIKYDAVIVDEAQDCDFFTAAILRMHLKNDESNLYVFYDKTQNVYNKDFKDGFMIDTKPFYLRENLRNTASIYGWAQKNTNLGIEVITNQIVGPTPTSIVLNDLRDARELLENKLVELIEKEYVNKKFITVLSDNENFELLKSIRVGKWYLAETLNPTDEQISFYKVEDFKGLESNVIIYIHFKKSNTTINYVAYTRAKYYLYEFVIK